MSQIITIAGSGPSTELIDHVTVTTQSSIPADYLFLRVCNYAQEYKIPLMVYYHRKGVVNVPVYYADSAKWDKYYLGMAKPGKGSPPQYYKASTDLSAVLAVVDRWNPKEIGLIGFDSILDEDPEFHHNAKAEKACIESLVKIVDLREAKKAARSRPRKKKTKRGGNRSAPGRKVGNRANIKSGDGTEIESGA